MYTIATVLAGVLWGCISLFLKPLSSAGFSSLQIMVFRAVLSALMLLVYLALVNPKLLKIHLRDIWMFIGTGVVSLTFFSICYFKTILEIGTSVAVILLYTSPIFVLLLSVLLFKEKINLIKILALVMTFLGSILVAGIAGGGSQITAKGFFIGLCAGFGYALYSIFSRFALRKYHSLTVTFYTFVFSGLSLMPFAHLGELTGFGEIKIAFLIVGIALFCSVLPYIFYTFGLSGLENGRAAILVTVEPLVGTLIGFFVWNEPFSFTKGAGIILIFAAVIMLGLTPAKEIK